MGPIYYSYIVRILSHDSKMSFKILVSDFDLVDNQADLLLSLL